MKTKRGDKIEVVKMVSFYSILKFILLLFFFFFFLESWCCFEASEDIYFCSGQIMSKKEAIQQEIGVEKRRNLEECLAE